MIQTRIWPCDQTAPQRIRPLSRKQRDAVAITGFCRKRSGGHDHRVRPDRIEDLNLLAIEQPVSRRPMASARRLRWRRGRSAPGAS